MYKYNSKLISRLIIALPVVSVLISIFLISLGAVYTIKKTYEKELANTEKHFFDNLKIITKKRVTSVYNIIEALNGGELKDKNKILKIIRGVMDRLRWPENGYIFIFDSKGNTIYHINREFLGKNRWNAQRHGQKIVQMIINAALKNKNGSFVKYYAYYPGKEYMEKISFVKYYKPLDLVIGSGIYLNYLNKDLIAQKNTQKELLDNLVKIIIFISFVVTVVTLLIMYLISFVVNRIFKTYDRVLESERKKLYFKANFDNLTKLCNRECFSYKLKDTLNETKRNGLKFAVVFIDIDYFKQINDTDGHKVGDRVLKIIAERLKSCVRETDIVSRFGGDEFIILLKNIKSVEEIVDYVERILSALKEEMVINGKKYYVSGSIGISVYPDNGADLDKLIVYADMAMYNSKENGKDRFSFYNEDTNVAAEKFLTFKNELLNAIKKEEFDIFFQPQYDKNGKYYGSEVLVRWHHPQKGFLTPDKFISYAVKLGIMDKIDLYVFKKAVNFYKELYSKNLNPGVLSFNVTVNQLHKKSFYDELLFLLKENEIDAEHLNLEITEESVMKNVKLSVKMLKSIKSLGMGISIDDFGTGYSSMAYLKKLPIDKIKIDKSFVENIPASRDDVIITKAIIHLAADLGMKIIAEGVKTYEQFDFLKNTGCDYLQGEYFSMPVDRDEFEKMLKENNDFK